MSNPMISVCLVKTCINCKKLLSHREFHKMAASPDQITSKCKSCVNEYSVNWRLKNPTAHKEWYQKNKESRSAYNARWRAENLDFNKARFAAWAKANPHKVNALIMKRYAAKLKATPIWANKVAIERIYEQASRLTIETGVRYDVDHIVPLQGKIVSGLHCEANLQVLPKAQNISKSNRYWPNMP